MIQMISHFSSRLCLPLFTFAYLCLHLFTFLQIMHLCTNFVLVSSTIGWSSTTSSAFFLRTASSLAQKRCLDGPTCLGGGWTDPWGAVEWRGPGGKWQRWTRRPTHALPAWVSKSKWAVTQLFQICWNWTLKSVSTHTTLLRPPQTFRPILGKVGGWNLASWLYSQKWDQPRCFLGQSPFLGWSPSNTSLF